MSIETACQIIMKEVNNQIPLNIIDLENLKEMLDQLTNICGKIKQKIVYLISQKFFNYLQINQKNITNLLCKFLQKYNTFTNVFA